MKFALWRDLPRALCDELEAAGLDLRETYELVVRALEEDLPGEDAAGVAAFDGTVQGTADFVARESGTVAGLAIAELVFYCVMELDLVVVDRVPDGTRVSGGDVVLSVRGPVSELLAAERTALNFACHLSGVATATAAWVEAVDGTKARILDTRKTLPGLRALQKYAVRCGGGVNHRFSLSDMAMVKDNHVIAAGGVVPAYEGVKRRWPGLPVEVEVTDLDQLRELLDAGCERILLDNMSDDLMAEAVRIRDEHPRSEATLEASGGLTLDRARDVAGTGVDFISVGALTHSVKVFDIGMDLSEAR